jgi:hypothetical protein
MAKSNPSRYAQLKSAEAAPAGTAGSNLVPLVAARHWKPSVKHEARGPAAATLKIEIRPGDELDASFLLALPELWRPFADAALAWCRRTEVTSTETEKVFLTRLNTGFVAYLKETGHAGLSLEQLNTGIVNGFVTWLTAAGDDGTTYARNSRVMALGTLKGIVDQLRKMPSYASRLHKKLSFPRNPWPGGWAIRNVTSVLSESDWEKLYNVCATEVADTVRSIMKDWDDVEELIDTVRLDGKAADYKDRRFLLAAMAKAYPEVIPERNVMKREYPNLAQAIAEYHGLGELRALNPFPADLVPFVILLEIYTNFNGDPLLGIEFESIYREEVMGFERIIFAPYKGRAKRNQIRSFAINNDDATAPSCIVDFLTSWTRRIRVQAPKEYRNRLFLYTPTTKSRAVRSFGNRKTKPSQDKQFKYNLESFLEKRGLPDINFRELRASGLDFTHRLFRGDLRAVQAVGGQRRPQVISDHYTSDAARRRNDERLVEVMSTRERWRETNGKVDPRGFPENQDLGACTPGWRCADPYDSPIPGESPGRLCAAFGACPGCPLAGVDNTSSFALAGLLTLKREMEDAQSYLPLRANEDETSAPRKFKLEGVGNLFRGHAQQDAPASR